MCVLSLHMITIDRSAAVMLCRLESVNLGGFKVKHIHFVLNWLLVQFTVSLEALFFAHVHFLDFFKILFYYFDFF